MMVNSSANVLRRMGLLRRPRANALVSFIVAVLALPVSDAATAQRTLNSSPLRRSSHHALRPSCLLALPNRPQPFLLVTHPFPARDFISPENFRYPSPLALLEHELT